MFKNKDIIIYSIIIILTFFLYKTENKKTNHFNLVIGEKKYTYSLNINREIEIQGAIIKVEDKKVFIKETDCKNKYCLHQGSINRSGECIICVPKKMIISIGEDLDALSW